MLAQNTQKGKERSNYSEPVASQALSLFYVKLNMHETDMLSILQVRKPRLLEIKHLAQEPAGLCLD